MGNISSHTASFLGGGTLFSAVLGILATQFHMDAGLATDWLIVAGAVMGGPVMAYLSVKAKDDPALAAALATISAMQASNGTTPPHGVTVTPTGGGDNTVTVTTTPAPPPPTTTATLPPTTPAPEPPHV
jgi:hypothetical protein